MHIYIKEPASKPISIRFPTRMLVNNLSAGIASAAMKKHLSDDLLTSLNAAQLRRLVRVLHKCKRLHPDMYLVEVESSSGEIVRIKL